MPGPVIENRDNMGNWKGGRVKRGITHALTDTFGKITAPVLICADQVALVRACFDRYLRGSEDFAKRSNS